MSAAPQKSLEELEHSNRPLARNAAVPDHEVIIVGAGFSGLGVAIELKRRGIDHFTILERESEVGGTWRDNSYPGIAVDISSFVYSYSFEQNANWTRVFAPGRELFDYARRVATKYGLYPHLRFGVSVDRADFDEDTHIWHLQTSQGAITARHLVSAPGALVTPKLPDIKGIGEFKGKIMHTARWEHDYDLAGKRVAVIGTGATAVQLVPELAKQVKQLDVYQRTPIWVLNKPDGRIPSWMRNAFRYSGLPQRSLRMGFGAITEAIMVMAVVYHKQMPWMVKAAEKVCLKNLRKQLPDRPDLWEKLTPQYGFGCKRPTFSNEYFSTFARENVELVTDGIESITPNGIRTADGTDREIDVLICATGFKVFEKGNLPTFEVHGRDGAELGEFWHQNRYQAYEGMTVPGYPNFYLMLGPYSLTATSWFVMVEGNATHIGRCLDTARKRNATCVEIKQEAHDAYFQNIQDRQQNTVFLNRDCGSANSYYFDRHGDAPFARPSSSVEMLWRAKTLPMKHYRFQRARNAY